ncbi:glycosyltransferase [Terrimicrobium sacchariphilum]|uniref:Glycosyltransferase n=1 Tax=Terrimicrobium sacchariphilum TaxID=690879 RepID=A0A146G2Y2_TERSA|nr:glycosyltransferase family 2 protein [Terrimicrobium sacchariphilum]GAT32010.1 glycosyltransferase [Terrimicrobium sacchariphilum]
MPSVSIVIASYNSAEYLPATLVSCLNQVTPAREIIVIDDGSTDDTPAVCAGFGESITYRRVENGGVSAARNLGAKLATSDWILFLDSDDVLLQTAVASLLARSEQVPSAGVVYGMVLQRMEPPQEPRLSGFDYCAGDPPLPAQRNLYRCAIITPGSAIVRREVHLRVEGFVSGYEPMEDRDYWIKCGLLKPVAFCDTAVLDKTWRPASAGTQDAKRIYRSLLAQVALRKWCKERGIDFSWAPKNAGFAREAIRQALFWKTPAIMPALLRKADDLGYRGLWYFRAQLELLKLRFTGGIPPEPAWLNTPTGIR